MSAPAPTEWRLSPNINEVTYALRNEKVTAWTLITSLLRNKREYDDLAARVDAIAGPQGGQQKSVQNWITDALAVLDPSNGQLLHTRLLIVALASRDSTLAQHLERADGLLSLIKSEFGVPLDSRLRAPSESSGAPVAPPKDSIRVPDPTPLHLDTPATVDHLGRRGFARALATRLEKIWREMNPAGAKKAAATHAPRGSFILHLHGEWGSGKSSILEFLRTALTAKREAVSPRTPAVATPWIVVDFNAWQNQRLDPPWWPLLNNIYLQSIRQLAKQRSLLRTISLWLRVKTWRLVNRWRDVLIFTFLAGVLAYPAYRLLNPAFLIVWTKLEEYGATAENLGKIVALVATICGSLIALSRALLSGSARAAQSFLETAADPMERIQRHFQKMVGTIERPIAVFVDDLDRCQSGYVVQLLEGIQTLFRDPRVVYVIAADQRWLHACFERTYADFAESVHEPGRRLGSLFLEKAFEISIAVPNLSPAVQAEYWRHLLGGDSEAIEREAATFEREARAEFAEAASEQQVVSRLAGEKRAATDDAPAEAPNPLRDRIRREAAVERLANATIEKSVSYFLHPFAPLLDPNPRSMKRLLNAYAIRRDLAILAGQEVLVDEARRKKLALWVILSLRWPAIEDDLRARAAGLADEPTEEVAALLQTAEVRRIVEYLGAESPLTLADIAGFEGFEALNEPQSPAAAE